MWTTSNSSSSNSALTRGARWNERVTRAMEPPNGTGMGLPMIIRFSVSISSRGLEQGAMMLTRWPNRENSWERRSMCVVTRQGRPNRRGRPGRPSCRVIPAPHRFEEHPLLGAPADVPLHHRDNLAHHPRHILLRGTPMTVRYHGNSRLRWRCDNGRGPSGWRRPAPAPRRCAEPAPPRPQANTAGFPIKVVVMPSPRIARSQAMPTTSPRLKAR